MLVIKSKVLYEGEVQLSGYHKRLPPHITANLKNRYIEYVTNNFNNDRHVITVISTNSLYKFGDVNATQESQEMNTQYTSFSNKARSIRLNISEEEPQKESGQYTLELYTFIKLIKGFQVYTKEYIEELVTTSVDNYIGGENGLNYTILTNEQIQLNKVMYNLQPIDCDNSHYIGIDTLAELGFVLFPTRQIITPKNHSISITNSKSKQFMNEIKNIPQYEDLVKECKRIENSNVKEFYGYPVNYIVEGTDTSTLFETSNIIYSYLLNNNRAIINDMKIVDEKYIGEHDGGDIFKPNIGSALLIDLRCWDSSFDTDAISSSMRGKVCITDVDLINFVESYKKYNNKILLFFLIDPKMTEKLKTIINNMFSVVTIKVRSYSYNRSINYIKGLCKVDNIDYSNKLLKKGDTYTQTDLNNLYMEYRDVYLKKNIYKEYNRKEFIITKAERTMKGVAYRELNNMIGLKNVKDVINQILSFCKMQKVYKDKGITITQPSKHMIFTGNPGTAKTTVARLLGKILKDNDILISGNVVEIGRSDLVEKYVGWTSKNVKSKIMKAKGGILFIDEAYSLVDDRRGSFGDEVINTLVEQMDNIREHTIVILAGYPDKMEEFMDTNPGIRSRINFHVKFDNYSIDDLIEILKNMANEKKLTLSDEFLSLARKEITAAINSKDFGNGRFVRSLLERSIMKQSERLLKDDIYVKMKNTEIMTIDHLDIPDMNIGKKDKKRIGFDN